MRIAILRSLYRLSGVTFYRLIARICLAWSVVGTFFLRSYMNTEGWIKFFICCLVFERRVRNLMVMTRAIAARMRAYWVIPESNIDNL